MPNCIRTGILTSSAQTSSQAPGTPVMHTPPKLPAPASLRQQEARVMREQYSGNRDSARLHRVARERLTRLDQVIASSMALTHTRTDCRGGWSYCCYYKVALPAPAPFPIAQHTETR